MGLLVGADLDRAKGVHSYSSHLFSDGHCGYLSTTVTHFQFMPGL